MKNGCARQYGNGPCVIIEPGDKADDVVEYCMEIGAEYPEGDDVCFVVQFPDRFPELYSERALRSSINKMPPKLYSLWSPGTGTTGPHTEEEIRKITNTPGLPPLH